MIHKTRWRLAVLAVLLLAVGCLPYGVCLATVLVYRGKVESLLLEYHRALHRQEAELVCGLRYTVTDELLAMCITNFERELVFQQADTDIDTGRLPTVTVHSASWEPGLVQRIAWRGLKTTPLMPRVTADVVFFDTDGCEVLYSDTVARIDGTWFVLSRLPTSRTTVFSGCEETLLGITD